MSEEQVVGSPEREIHVQALVQLEKIDISKQEENEEELFKMRAKLYRFFTEKDENGWKERGVGEMKIMKHKTKGTVRIVMRRDKTYKLCANHAITEKMEIKHHMGNEKALIWNTPSDYADGEPKPEMLCVRFGKPESATEFKDKFEECAKLSGNGSTDDAKKLADDLSALNVKDEKDKTEEEVKENGKSEKGKKTADSTVEALKSTTEETPKSSSDTTATETASKD